MLALPPTSPDSAGARVCDPQHVASRTVLEPTSTSPVTDALRLTVPRSGAGARIPGICPPEQRIAGLSKIPHPAVTNPRHAGPITVHLRERKGFSLVELLVVMALITVLTGLLLAALAQARGRAQRIQCAGNVRQLGVGLLAFVADNAVYPLEANPNYRAGVWPEHLSTWPKTLQYTELSVPGSGTTNRIPFSQWSGTSVWKCPAANKPSNWYD